MTSWRRSESWIFRTARASSSGTATAAPTLPRHALKPTPDARSCRDPARFPEDFAADLPSGEAVFEARSRVLAAAKVFSAPFGAAAWKTKPSWAIVARADKIINPDLERWYYTRARSHTIELDGASHSVYESRPKEVAAVIEDAAQKAQN